MAVTVPKNTIKTDPVVNQIVLPKGRIKQIAYHFPLGCKGLAHLTIWSGGIQLYPRSQNLSYYGDAMFRFFPCDYELPEAFNILTFKCWNWDDTWDHLITTHITVLKEETPTWINKLFFGLTGRSE